MINYDWQKVKVICNYDPVNILQYFCFKEKIWLPPYINIPYERKVYLAAKELYPEGSSYILNIRPLLRNERGFYLDEIYEYLSLASMRNHFDYVIRGVYTLPERIAKVSNGDYKKNPLLEVIGDEIHFKYETDENRGK